MYDTIRSFIFFPKFTRSFLLLVKLDVEVSALSIAFLMPLATQQQQQQSSSLNQSSTTASSKPSRLVIAQAVCDSIAVCATQTNVTLRDELLEVNASLK